MGMENLQTSPRLQPVLRDPEPLELNFVFDSTRKLPASSYPSSELTVQNSLGFFGILEIFRILENKVSERCRTEAARGGKRQREKEKFRGGEKHAGCCSLARRTFQAQAKNEKLRKKKKDKKRARGGACRRKRRGRILQHKLLEDRRNESSGRARRR